MLRFVPVWFKESMYLLFPCGAPASSSRSDMAKSDPTKDPEFKRVLGNLLSAPPKLHSEMKLGKPRSKPSKSPKAKKKAPRQRG